MHHPIVKVTGDQGCQGYLVGCPESREAVLVDPKVGRRAVIQGLLDAYQLKLRWVLDTHSHADHLSDSVSWIGDGVTLLMSRHTACRRPMRRVEHGEEIPLGELRFRIREVPGHTPDSIAWEGHGLVLCGDSMLVGGLARADFRGSDPEQLFESVRDQLLTLPDDTLVFPGHCYNDLVFSTVAEERRSNAAMQFPSGAAYADDLGAVEGQGNTPEVDMTLQLNLEENPDLPDDPRAVTACCSAGGAGAMVKAREQLPQDTAARRESFTSRGAWIDVRDPYEYRAGHVPGAVNVPLGELGFHLDELRGKDPLLFQCKSGVRSMTAARTLVHLGVVQDPISLARGFDGWVQAGLATV